MRITKECLEAESACARQVKEFAREWPDGADLTLENVQRAVALGLDVAWFFSVLGDGHEENDIYEAVQRELQAPWQEAIRFQIPSPRILSRDENVNAAIVALRQVWFRLTNAATTRYIMMNIAAIERRQANEGNQ